LKCSYRNRPGIAVGIPLEKSDYSENEFYRHPRERLLDVYQENFERAKEQNIYILGSERIEIYQAANRSGDIDFC
jgi:hypothetical protein